MNARQLTFDDAPALPYVKGSETSRAAAVAMRPRAGTTRERLLCMFEDWPLYGFTDEEGIDRLGMNPSTYRPRRIELWRAGFIEDSGERRPTQSGELAVVWRLTSAPLPAPQEEGESPAAHPAISGGYDA